MGKNSLLNVSDVMPENPRTEQEEEEQEEEEEEQLYGIHNTIRKKNNASLHQMPQQMFMSILSFLNERVLETLLDTKSSLFQNMIATKFESELNSKSVFVMDLTKQNNTFDFIKLRLS